MGRSPYHRFGVDSVAESGVESSYRCYPEETWMNPNLDTHRDFIVCDDR